MSQIILYRTDSGGSVAAHVDDVLVIRLPENATTGFRWAIERTDAGVARIVVLESDGYATPLDEPAAPDVPVPSGDPGTNVPIGRGGTREFRYRVTVAGKTRLVFRHWQEWSGEASVTDRFEVEVVARVS